MRQLFVAPFHLKMDEGAPVFQTIGRCGRFTSRAPNSS